MHLQRARFDNIVSEFIPSKRPSNKVVIFCYGMPGYPKVGKAMEYFSSKGYWVFLPRYRGTWESGGTFLDHSPHEDILDVIPELSKPFKSIWDGEEYQIDNPEFYIVGSSFGGSVAILCSLDPRVTKVIATGSVVDWREEKKSPAEPMEWLGRTVRDAFGEGYRFSDADWERLSNGELYNPANHIAELDPKKILLLHSIDDDVVLYEPVKRFAEEVRCQLITLKKGGHLGSKSLVRWGVRRKIWKFLKE
jgi:pimeloyl-ACP methyl ester carboxylesterase